jgi:hypothetical protein
MESYFGLTRGVVGAAMDPLGQGRVRVDLPSLGVERAWAEVVVQARSSMAPGAVVVVGFVEGDVGRPVVLGALGPDGG